MTTTISEHRLLVWYDSFPTDYVWEQSENGWYRRPVTKEDRERRREFAKEMADVGRRSTES
jgi:hypothetical protein